MIRLTKEESGYSLVEVLAAIVILSIAIIPMVGMFDAGLKAASTSGNYDKARALANLKLEEARSLPYDLGITDPATDVKNDFPAASTTPNGSGVYTDPSWRDYTGFNSANFTGLQYEVHKQYLAQPPTNPTSASQGFANKSTDDGLIKVTVTVKWGSGNTYSTYGVVAK